METTQISLETLAEKAASGETLTAHEKLAIVSRRPTPTRKEWLALYVVWIVRGTFDLDKAVGPKSIAFLKRYLSVPVFAYVTKSLSEDYEKIIGAVEAVTMLDIKRMLDHGERLRELQRQAAKEQLAADAIAQQRAACRQ